jgi:hypothetical protein
MADPDWKDLAKSPQAWDSLEHDDPRLDSFSHAVEDRYGLPRGVVEAIKNAGERTPSRTSGKPTESPKGAKGVMQFIDKTRKVYQHDVDDPFESIDAAGRYMAEALKQYDGNVMAAIADYNGGPVQGKPVASGKAPPASETKAYLQRIKDYMNERYRGE